MKREKNTPIGEVECSHKGCSQKCAIFRYRQRTPGKNSMFAGKLYADCPVHGRIGADGKQASQDYILENGKIWGANDRPANPATEPEKLAPNPASTSSSPATSKPPNERSAKPAPNPASSSSHPWTGFGFFRRAQ